MNHSSTRVRSKLQILIVVSLLLATFPIISSVRARTALPQSAAPTGCPPGETETMIWPVLDSLNPSTIAPGMSVVVSGHGGYVKCSGGLYDESARSFDLTFDGVALDDLGCYVNHCQTTITIPDATMSGQHIIATEGGSQITVQVQPRALNHVVYLPQLTK